MMYRSEIRGRGGITAKVVEATASPKGKRITTLELKYPRFIHSELMTHRQFSRNASSSRAIPIENMMDQVERRHAEPIEWGKNQKGMQASTTLDGVQSGKAGRIWCMASCDALAAVDGLNELKVHKQLVNRLLEPFQFISVIVTATQWENFFNLRSHKDAQPEIKELADCMALAMRAPEYKEGSHHLPYLSSDERKYDYTEAASISAARCARVSYLTHDKKEPCELDDLILADRLLSSGHMSPFEHQATAMSVKHLIATSGKGYTHIKKDLSLWSGNFKGWVQFRQEL